MIKSCIINNFKGIKELSMDTITPVTLVSGKNNVGKSSLLEALFLLYDHTSPESFARLSSLRSGYIEPVVRLWEPLFHKMDTDEDIKIMIKNQDDTEQVLRYYKDTSFAPSNPDGGNPELMGQLRASVKASYSLGAEFTDGDYKESAHFSASVNGILLNMSTSYKENERKNMPTAILISPATARVTQELAEWVGVLEINERKHQIIDALKIISSDIADIVSVPRNGTVQLYVKGRNGMIPLKYAGDGMVRLVFMVSAVMSNPGSIILIDEIENGFHYSMYSKLWEVLAVVAKEYGSQILATSHSYECIMSALKGLKDAGREEEFSLHRFDNNDGVIKDNAYDPMILKTAMDMNMEVR